VTAPGAGDSRKAALLLAGGNLAFNLLGVLTGPILARALGPSGRGTLAAILVPLSVAPYIAGLGLTAFALRTAARDRQPRVLVPTLALVALAIGVVLLPLLPTVVSVLGEGRDVVETFLMAGLLLLPAFILVNVLLAVVTGLERWNLVVAARLLQPVSALVALLTLWATDRLTVATAAVTGIGSTLILLVPTAVVLRGRGPLRFKPALARQALAFGIRAWPGTLSEVANTRLDQVLMIPLVDPAQLGQYVVAYTAASAPAIVASAIVSAVVPRIARGEEQLVAGGSRVLLPVVVAAGLLIGALAPIAIPLLFGRDFAPAVPLTWILLVAAVPGLTATFLGATLTAAGRPGTATAGQMLALAVTLPGLLLLLGPLGAYGAAIVSVAAYSANFAFIFVAARRRFGGAVLDYLVPRHADLQLLKTTIPWRRR
jgi:O-antigen/teichoic acid export membrane protein